MKRRYTLTKAHKHRQAGYSLLELSISLVVIGILLSITITGIDVYRNATGVRIYSDYIQTWTGVFNTYMTRSGGILPGDNSTTPAGMVLATIDTPLCDDPNGTLALSSAMLAYGLTLPVGRGPNQASRYVYEDKNGLPHELNVCLVTTSWTVQTAKAGGGIVYTPVNKTVLRISGLTPDLASQISNMVDGRVDAGLGTFREHSPLNYDTSQVSMNWSSDASQNMSGDQNAEKQTTEVTGDLLLD